MAAITICSDFGAPKNKVWQFPLCPHLFPMKWWGCPTLCDTMNYSLPGSSVHGDSPGKNTGMGHHALLQGIFPMQGSNPGLPLCRWILYQLRHQGSPRILECVAYPFSRGSSRPRNWTRVSCIAGRFFTSWATREYSRLISFRMDRFDLLAVQGTLKSLLQHHSSKASILWRSAFFMVQLSQLFMTTGKNIALTSQTFIGKVLSLLFNMLSRFVIVFLSRSKSLLISWLK